MIYQGASPVSSYLYHAQACAIGGSIVRPVMQNVNAPAASVLTSAGGYQTSIMENYKLENIISIRKAVTQVSGSKGANAYNSFASVEIEGLNIENELTADRIVAKLSNTVPIGGDEPAFSVGGCLFVNLRIGGILVEPELAIDLHTSLSTFSALESAWDDAGNNNHSALRSAARQWYLPQADIDKQAASPNGFAIHPAEKTRNGRLRVSLLKGLKGEIPHLDRQGMTIHVPNFGKIHLCEMFIGKYSRTLTMLRMQLGSPVEGDESVGYLDLNGLEHP
ncbi:MAG: hypothetical protein JST93_35535 [Acidobacteria bacterium]|nr:hypothetical protein [Acidobacteriota bacterium]